MSPRKPPRSRDAYAIFQPMQTRWNDNDQFGHLYNATYIALFDEAMNMTLLGMGLLDHRGPGPIQVVVENGCTYFREVAHPDRLQIGLRVEALGNSSIRIELGMFRETAQAESARAFFVLVTVDNDTRRPIPTPAPQLDAFRSLQAAPQY